MQTPVDYPLFDHAHSAQFTVDELAYATLLDRTETLLPSRNVAGIDVTANTLESSETLAFPDNQLSKPFALIAQSWFARDSVAINDEHGGAVDSMFSRWSRTRR